MKRREQRRERAEREIAAGKKRALLASSGDDKPVDDQPVVQAVKTAPDRRSVKRKVDVKMQQDIKDLAGRLRKQNAEDQHAASRKNSSASRSRKQVVVRIIAVIAAVATLGMFIVPSLLL
jgi:chromatin segregation and condensation protein Rec8/ScpA/Scc1 (kleisin family)